jgi:hypothetical protein
MTILNGSSTMPVLSIEDSFKLTYLGKHGVLHYDKALNTNEVEVVDAPLPVGKYVWDGVDHLGGMQAGEDRFVPFDVVRVYFGDPRSIMTAGQRFEDRKGNVGDIAPRPEETRRLGVLYGLYDSDAAKVRDIVPMVKISTAAGEEIVCPATDPEGLHVYGHIADKSENYDLATTIETLKMQVRMLEEAQKANERKGDDNSGGDVEVDGPKNRRAASA